MVAGFNILDWLMVIKSKTYQCIDCLIMYIIMSSGKWFMSCMGHALFLFFWGGSGGMHYLFVKVYAPETVWDFSPFLFTKKTIITINIFIASSTSSKLTWAMAKYFSVSYTPRIHRDKFHTPGQTKQQWECITFHQINHACHIFSKDEKNLSYKETFLTFNLVKRIYCSHQQWTLPSSVVLHTKMEIFMIMKRLQKVAVH